MQRAFSLVELSIVLVILGLLVGGVLAGQSLIRAAELRSVTTEFHKYQAAANIFRDKYFSIPGDMANATAFWGATACPASAGTGTQTCNGDGDGTIDNAPAANQYGEPFTFWQHLANAGLIEGGYTGIAGSANIFDSSATINSPKSKLGNSGWSAFWLTSSFSGNGNEFAVDYGNHFRFGAEISGGGLFYGSSIKPDEAWNIDSKIDDGKPGTGKIIAYNWDGCTDAASHGGVTVSDRTGASYLISDISVVCSLAFVKSY